MVLIIGRDMVWLVPVGRYTWADVHHGNNEFIFLFAQRLVVHCLQGQGRTGTMNAAYLVHHDGLDPVKAILETRRRRPRSIETKQQEQTVHDYHRYIVKTKTYNSKSL